MRETKLTFVLGLCDKNRRQVGDKNFMRGGREDK